MQNIYLQPNRSACHDGFVERGCEKSQKHFVDRTFLHVKNVRLCAISAASSFCCCFRLRVDTHKAIPTVRLGERRRQEERRFPRGTGRRLKISLLRSSSGLRWQSPARVERHITRNWRCRRAASCWQMHLRAGHHAVRSARDCKYIDAISLNYTVSPSRFAAPRGEWRS